MFEKVMDLFCEIKEADEVNTLLLFNACARLGTSQALNRIKEVSSKMPCSFYSHPNVTNSLIDAYLKCDDLDSAEFIFRRSAAKDSTMYAAMMKSRSWALFNLIIVTHKYLSIGCINHKRYQKAIDLFSEIEKPNEMVMVLVINACAQLRTNKALEMVKTLTCQMPMHFSSNEHIITSLIDALMKCGDVEGAEQIFSRSKMRNQAIYGAMMKGKTV